MLSDKSISDFDSTKKAEYYDLDGYMVADEKHKDKLNQPEPIEKLNIEEK